MAQNYVTPTLTTLGSLADLTLAKNFGNVSDGDFVSGQPIYSVSCACDIGAS